MITESDRIRHAIELAANLWPENRGERSLLLRKILETGIAAIEAEVALKQEGRLAGIEAAAGSMTKVWPKDWRKEMTGDWPE